MSAESDRELSDLLPWLANGTLSGTERSEVEDLLRRSPEAGLELQLWKAVNAEVRRATVDSGVEMGWRRFQKQLKQSESAGRLTPRWRIAAAAAAVALVSLQSVIVWQGTRDAELTQLGGPASVVNANEWLVQIRFDDTATISQINELLQQIDARIVNGPSALGLYDIAVIRGDRFADSAALLAWLRQQPIVREGAVPP